MDARKSLAATPRDGTAPEETHALMLNLRSQLGADPARKGSLPVRTAGQGAMGAFDSSEDPAALKHSLEDIVDGFSLWDIPSRSTAASVSPRVAKLRQIFPARLSEFGGNSWR